MLPIDFIDNMEEQMGDELDLFCSALQQEPTLSVRFNTKTDTFALPFTDEVPWHPDGYYLSSRPQFTLDPLMHAGCYYVQDASSMFLYHVLEQYVRPDSVILDLCAAPGGKATLISEYIGNEGLLVANEVVRQRVFILSENIQKWGNGNTIVSYNKPQEIGSLLQDTFDCMVVDAPCSGEGMFRKDPEAIKQWSLQNIKVCAERQKNILRDAWAALKENGILIYSTCTFNSKENEEIAHFIQTELGAELLTVPIDPQWGITHTVGYHFYPHKVRGEGFYIAVFRKLPKRIGTTQNKDFSYKPKKNHRQTEHVECENMLRDWLLEPDQWVIRQSDRFSIAYSLRYRELIDFIRQRLTCISVGFGIGEMRGHLPAPQHSLAMSKHFRQTAFPQIEVTEDDALRFLRTESMVFEGAPMGYLLIKFQDVPLGFVKNVGNHSNNIYPNEWRIRKL